MAVQNPVPRGATGGSAARRICDLPLGYQISTDRLPRLSRTVPGKHSQSVPALSDSRQDDRTGIRQFRSGELVVFHDDTLDRVTDDTGEVTSTPLSALRETSILDSDQRSRS